MYTMASYKHDFGQTITTDAEGVGVDRAFLAHYHVAAADATAESDTAVMGLTVLGTAAASITAGLTNPAVPRNIKVDASTNITTKVKVHGTNFAGEVISEELELTGTTAKAGSLAFKTITKVDLPARTNVPAKQTETIQVTAGCSTSGDIAVAVTATTLLGAKSGASVTVTLSSTDHDSAAEVVAAVVDALNEDADISAVFTASITGDDADTILLTTNEYAANDTSLAIAFTAGDTGVTVGSSTNGTSGVAEDKVSVGLGKKFGLPYKLYTDELVILKLFNKAVENTEGAVTADASNLEKNVYAPNGTPDGTKDIDLYIIV